MALVLGPLQADEVALAADGADVETRICRDLDRRLRPRIVGEDDGWRTLAEKIAEQPHLGAVIVLDVGVVVEVIAPEIGEAARRQLHPVQPVLVEAVARRLHRRMGDAAIGKLGEQSVQRHRIRRRQRPVFTAARRYHAGRPDARGGISGVFPNLAQEGSDRRLAAGSGHRCHGRGLAAEKQRGGLRKRQAGILYLEHRDGKIAGHRISRGDDRDRPARGGILREPRAVGLGAMDGKEQRAGNDGARVGRHGTDLEPAGAVDGQDAGKFTEFHQFPVESLG